MEGFEFIMQRFDQLEEKFDEKLTAILEETTETKIQTTKTNGRVTNAENIQTRQQLDIETLKQNMNFNRGRDRVIYVLLGVILTLIGWLTSK